jgi:hypothetical protein
MLVLSSGRSGVGSLVILGVGGGPCILGCGASGTAGGTRGAVPAVLCIFVFLKYWTDDVSSSREWSLVATAVFLFGTEFAAVA